MSVRDYGDKRDTGIFAGLQAQGTVGLLLVGGIKDIPMRGQDFTMKGEIATLVGFSAHAGQMELIDWVRNFQPPRHPALLHGEASALQTLSSKLSQYVSLAVRSQPGAHDRDLILRWRLSLNVCSLAMRQNLSTHPRSSMHAMASTGSLHLSQVSMPMKND